MILTRRRFMQAAAGTLFVAPAIVRAESLMKVFTPPEPSSRFRVPDLRGHFATRPEPLNVYPEREMTAVQQWAQQNEVREGWDTRYQTSIRAQYAEQSMKAVNKKIDDDVMNSIGGHQHTGVWMDESPQTAVRMEHLINQRTGEIVITDGPALGCIPCDGRELSAIEYPHLFQVLGNKYG